MSTKERFRPRRGKASTFRSKNPILLDGELVVEIPEAGVGKGPVKMKMGDGGTPYNDLKYAVEPQTNAGDHTITFTTSTTNDNTTLLNEIASGKALKSIIGSTKKLLSNFNTSISDMKVKYDSFNNAKSRIISSSLGAALGMTSNTTIENVANKIVAVPLMNVNVKLTRSAEVYQIPAGYHDGTGRVTGPTIPSIATIIGTSVSLNDANQLLQGVSAYGSRGIMYTGSMIDRSRITSSPLGAINSGSPDTPVYQTDLTQIALQSDNTQRICMRIPEGYYSKGTRPGAVDCYIGERVSAFGNAETGHVVSGRTFTSSAGFRVSGTHTCPSLGSLIGNNVTLDNGANLLSGVTAYGRSGYKYTGSHTCPSLTSLVGTSVTLNNANDLAYGVTAYGSGGTKYTGSYVKPTLKPVEAINSISDTATSNILVGRQEWHYEGVEKGGTTAERMYFLKRCFKGTPKYVFLYISFMATGIKGSGKEYTISSIEVEGTNFSNSTKSATILSTSESMDELYSSDYWGSSSTGSQLDTNQYVYCLTIDKTSYDTIMASADRDCICIKVVGLNNYGSSRATTMAVHPVLICE